MILDQNRRDTPPCQVHWGNSEELHKINTPTTKDKNPKQHQQRTGKKSFGKSFSNVKDVLGDPNGPPSQDSELLFPKRGGSCAGEPRVTNAKFGASPLESGGGGEGTT